MEVEATGASVDGVVESVADEERDEADCAVVIRLPAMIRPAMREDLRRCCVRRGRENSQLRIDFGGRRDGPARAHLFIPNLSTNPLSQQAQPHLSRSETHLPVPTTQIQPRRKYDVLVILPVLLPLILLHLHLAALTQPARLLTPQRQSRPAYILDMKLSILPLCPQEGAYGPSDKETTLCWVSEEGADELKTAGLVFEVD